MALLRFLSPKALRLSMKTVDLLVRHGILARLNLQASLPMRVSGHMRLHTDLNPTI
jgi:hypothetical protein